MIQITYDFAPSQFLLVFPYYFTRTRSLSPFDSDGVRTFPFSSLSTRTFDRPRLVYCLPYGSTSSLRRRRTPDSPFLGSSTYGVETRGEWETRERRGTGLDALRSSIHSGQLRPTRPVGESRLGSSLLFPSLTKTSPFSSYKSFLSSKKLRNITDTNR